MDQQAFQQVSQNSPEAIPTRMRRIEGREWWLWDSRCGHSGLDPGDRFVHFSWFNTTRTFPTGLISGNGYAGWRLWYYFSTFTRFISTWQLHRIRRQLAERDQLFQLISENAADMIALVDGDGAGCTTAPLSKGSGFSEDLNATSSIEQIHPDDRPRVLKAAEKKRA